MVDGKELLHDHFVILYFQCTFTLLYTTALLHLDILPISVTSNAQLFIADFPVFFKVTVSFLPDTSYVTV